MKYPIRYATLPTHLRGSLMIEVLVAIGIAAFAIAGLATLQSKTLRELRGNQEIMSSSVILSDAAERLLLASYDDVSQFIDGASVSNSVIEDDLSELQQNVENLRRVITFKEATCTSGKGVVITVKEKEDAVFDTTLGADTVSQTLCFYDEG